MIQEAIHQQSRLVISRMPAGSWAALLSQEAGFFQSSQLFPRPLAPNSISKQQALEGQNLAGKFRRTLRIGGRVIDDQGPFRKRGQKIGIDGPLSIRTGKAALI